MNHLIQSISCLDVFSIITPFLTIGTIIVALCTYRYQKRAKMTDDLFKMVKSFYEDKDIRMVLKRMDKEPEDGWKDNWFFNNDFIRGTDADKVDKLLYTFSYVCFMRKKKYISQTVFDSMGYYIKIAADDHETKNYLRYVRQMCKSKGLDAYESPLYYFHAYVEERESQYGNSEKIYTYIKHNKGITFSTVLDEFSKSERNAYGLLQLMLSDGRIINNEDKLEVAKQ